MLKVDQSTPLLASDNVNVRLLFTETLTAPFAGLRFEIAGGVASDGLRVINDHTGGTRALPSLSLTLTVTVITSSTLKSESGLTNIL
jgi:hypothetical protein